MQKVHQIEGTYSDGRNSTLISAVLCLTNETHIEITQAESGALIFMAGLTNVEVTSRLGNTPRAFSLPDGARFTTDNNDAVDDLLRQAGQSTSVMHFLESHTTAMVTAVVITVCVLGLYLVSGLPATAKMIAHSLPNDLVTTFGEGSLRIIDKTMLDPSELDGAKKSEVRGLLQPYLDAHSELKPNLVFRRGIGPNALALPDGTVVLTDELIELMPEDEELIAVTLHELGHLEHRHILRRVVQDSILAIGLVMITGDIEIAEGIIAIPLVALDLSYSRDLEREADHYALATMRDAGLDVEKFGTMMQRLEDYQQAERRKQQQEEEDESSLLENPLEGLSTYLTTHPHTKERVALVREYK